MDPERFGTGRRPIELKTRANFHVRINEQTGDFASGNGRIGAETCTSGASNKDRHASRRESMCGAK